MKRRFVLAALPAILFTLTGAAKMALGRDYHAVLSLDEERSHGLCQLAKKVNERAWPLPLEPWHQAQLVQALERAWQRSERLSRARRAATAAPLSR